MRFNVYVQQLGSPEELAVTALLSYQWQQYSVNVDMVRVATLSKGTATVAVEIEQNGKTIYIGGYWKLVEYFHTRGMILC